MAVNLRDYVYETDRYDANGLPSEASGSSSEHFLVRADTGLDTAERAGSVGENVKPTIAFHLGLFDNKKKFGLHPRYVELAREITGTGGSQCLLQKGYINKKMVVLTPARFTALVEENTSAGVAGTQITLGTGGNAATYRVVRKVAERRDGDPN